MESRSRVVTTNSSIFCVAKLDWQFIGNIRLRGVTPSFRVPCNQQKSLSLSLSILLPSTRWVQVWSMVGTSDPNRVTIPFQDSCCQCGPVTLFPGPMQLLEAAFASPSFLSPGLEWPPDDICILFAEFAAASIRFDDFRKFTLFTIPL